MPILAQDLKNAVLQAAMQGKLTKQFNNEYVDKKDLYIINDDEIDDDFILYEIPENWIYTNLESIVSKEIRRGKSPKYVKESNTLVFAQKCNLKQGGISLELAKYSNEEKANKYKVEEFMINHDIIVNSTGGGTLGRIGLFDECDLPPNKRIFPDSHVTIIRIKPIYSYEYVYFYLKFYQPYLEKRGVGSTNQTELKPLTLRKFPIPLPPIEEQKRIVDKLNEIMPLIDEYEKIEKQLVELKKEFPEDMKNAILQAAMQGKLTEQLDSDSSVDELLMNIEQEKNELIKQKKIKKEKPLAPITDDEVPFDISANWRWVKLGNISNLKMGKTPPRAESINWGNDYPWISIADMIPDGHINKTKEGISQLGYESIFNGNISPKGTLIMSFKLTVGRVSILDIDSLHNEAIVSILPYIDKQNILRDYLFKTLPFLSNYGDTKTAIKGKTLNSKSLNNLLIPIPPIEEQQRIVEKLNQLLPLFASLSDMD